MAELIDVACDICSQKYRLDAERLGTMAPCRECGTKFKIVEYTPPPDEDAPADSPWIWIRGAFVAAIVIAAVSLLGSLPFIRPSPVQARTVADGKQGAGNGRSSSTGSPNSTSKSKTPQEIAQEAQDQAKAFRKKHGLPEPNFPNNPFPGTIPGFPPQPTANATSSSGPDAKSGANVSQRSGNPPTISDWSFAAGPGPQTLHLTGRNLKNATKIQKVMPVGIFEVPFAAPSETKLEIRNLDLNGPDPTIIIVTTPGGVAVAFSDELRTVDKVWTDDFSMGSAFLVKKGGVLTSSRPVIVLLEPEGRAKITGITTLGIVKKGAELETGFTNAIVAEEGATVRQGNPIARPEKPPEVITFCPLPRLKNN
jgi:hypothetical protein